MYVALSIYYTIYFKLRYTFVFLDLGSISDLVFQI